MALNDFQHKFNYFEWMSIVTATLPFGTSVKHDETILVLTPDYFEALAALLAKSNKRTIVNYLIWRLINDAVPYLSNRDRLEAKLNRVKRNSRPPKWRDCVEITKKR